MKVWPPQAREHWGYLIFQRIHPRALGDSYDSCHRGLTLLIPLPSPMCLTAMRTPYNGLMDAAWCCARPNSNMGLELDTGFAVSSSECPAARVQDWIKGNGTLQIKGCNSIQIKITHLTMQLSENPFSPYMVRTPPQALSGEKDTSLSLITVW